MVRFCDFCRPSRLLPTLALIAALGLASTSGAWAAGPRLDPHDLQTSGDSGASLDPNGLRVASKGEAGGNLDPNGFQAAPQGEAGGNLDPNG